MSGAALETPNVGPRVTSIGDLIEAAGRADYPTARSALIARLNNEGAKRHLGAAGGRHRTIYYVTNTLSLAMQNALLARPAEPTPIPPLAPQTEEQEALANRFHALLSSKPKVAARVARDLRISIVDLYDMVQDGRRVTIEATLSVAHHFKMDLHSLITGEPHIDEDALSRSIHSKLYSILPHIQPTPGSIKLDLHGCNFLGEDAKSFYLLAIAAHLTEKLADHYRLYIAMREAHHGRR